MEFTDNLFIVLFVFLGYALVGFLDDYLIIKRHNNKGLTQLQKLFLQLVIALIFFYIFIPIISLLQIYLIEKQIYKIQI